MSWGNDGGQGSNQPRNVEDTLDGLKRDVAVEYEADEAQWLDVTEEELFDALINYDANIEGE